MRRKPQKIKEVCDYMDSIALKGVVDQMTKHGTGFYMGEVMDYMIPMLGHTICNNKQFDMFYAPAMKVVLDYAQEDGKQLYIYSEGSWEKFGEFFNEWPKGVINMTVEMDDPYKLRKLFPNICLTGGLDIDVLRYGTKENVVDMTKKAINELGANGGLVLMPSKLIMYKNDMNADNLHALSDYIVSLD